MKTFDGLLIRFNLLNMQQFFAEKEKCFNDWLNATNWSEINDQI